MSPEDRLARALARRIGAVPPVAVVLGSGLGEASLGRPLREIPYASIPGFPPAGVAGHPGRLTLTREALLLRGRAHFYQGHPMDVVVRPVRALARIGVRVLVLTNAAGGIRAGLRPGDLMLISDHLNLMGANPLRGAPAFADLTCCWDPGLRKRARAAARRSGVALREGVYAAMAGPSYETPAEVRMLRRLGADAVGMSTVPEAVAAAAEGMSVLGISVIANRAAGLARGPVSHAEVLAAMAGARSRVEALLRELTRAIRPNN